MYAINWFPEGNSKFGPKLPIFNLFCPQMTFTYLRGQKSLHGITSGYHMSMHAKNRVPRPYRLAVIEKCHVCDGQTDKQTDRQTENRHKLFLSLTFIDMTHINILILRHLVKILHTDRQCKFIIWYIYGLLKYKT